MSIEVKICGLTNREDAQHALDAGADYLGFVLYPKSPRGITAESLCEIVGALQGDFKAVGVFVNEPASRVAEVARDAGLHAVQIHGDEAAADFSGYKGELWRALRLAHSGAEPDPEEWSASRFVIDAAPPGRYGGAGLLADWSAAATFASSHSAMLAGGLTADNVARAVATVRPAGVDVSSGVEEWAGKKHHAQVEAFIRRAREGLRGA